MATKNNSRLSQQPYFDSHSEYEELAADIMVILEEWECGERTMVSTALENDKEYIELYSEAETYRCLIIEHLKNCDEKIAAMYQEYAGKMEELLDRAVCMGDMLAHDALTVRDRG
ncbi:MAG: hypothetical protein J6J86_00915 [Lachnospiraceae bacterium]|nr:hypothetical protein [Lachnospiraceae bacterium]